LSIRYRGISTKNGISGTTEPMRPSHLTEGQCFELSGSHVGYNVTCEDAGCPEVCPGDIDGDGQVGSVDILTVIGTWGPCP
jgi:hypothetical protein